MPADREFLLRLYSQKGNICIRSTNGISTQASERYYRLPTQINKIAREVDQLSSTHDIFITPSQTGNLARSREKRSPMPVWHLWCDLDDDYDESRLGLLKSTGGYVLVNSGSLGHLHLWLLLAESIDEKLAEDLNYRLASWLGADTAPTWIGAVLRLPGTYNHKNGHPSPVAIEDQDWDHRWSVAELEALLPRVARPTSEWNGEIPDPEPLPDDLSTFVTGHWGSEPGEHRYQQMWAAIKDCVTYGLTDGQVLTFMHKHLPTLSKIDDEGTHLESVVMKTLSKIRSEQPQPSADKPETESEDQRLERKIAKRAEDLFIEEQARERFLRRLEDDGKPNRLITGEQILAMPDPIWTIQKLMPDVGVGHLFGASYAGKSLLDLDLHLTLQNQLPDWHGFKVNIGGPTVYIALEGGFDLKLRLRAWAVGHPGCDINGIIGLVEERFDLGSPPSIDRLVNEIEELGINPILISIDTQGLATPGRDENSNTTLNLILLYAKRLAKRLHCFVLILHHTGWDETRVRGASAQVGGMDLIIHVESGKFTVTKVKAGKSGQIRYFKLVRVDLGQDQYGNDLDSVYVEPMGSEEAMNEELQAQVDIINYVYTNSGCSMNDVWNHVGGNRKATLDRIRGMLKAEGTRLTNIGTDNRPKLLVIEPQGVMVASTD